MVGSFNIIIFGVGAMATLYACRLDQLIKNQNSCFSQYSSINLAVFGNWTEQIRQIQKKGLRVSELDGSQWNSFIPVTANIDDLPEADIVLVLVKSYQTELIADNILKVLKPDGVVLTLQNGLGNIETLSRKTGLKKTGLGITTQGAFIPAPGILQIAGTGTTFLAAKENINHHLQIINLLFNKAGMKSEITNKAGSLVWGKLVINAAINPLTALLEIKNGELLNNKFTQEIMIKAASETRDVAFAQNITLPYKNPEQKLNEICHNTSNNYSSMLQDILNRRKTEIEAISGKIVEIGEQHHLVTPVNKKLLQLIKEKEKGERFNINQLENIFSELESG